MVLVLVAVVVIARRKRAITPFSSLVIELIYALVYFMSVEVVLVVAYY